MKLEKGKVLLIVDVLEEGECSAELVEVQEFGDIEVRSLDNEMENRFLVNVLRSFSSSRVHPKFIVHNEDDDHPAPIEEEIWSDYDLTERDLIIDVTQKVTSLKSEDTLNIWEHWKENLWKDGEDVTNILESVLGHRNIFLFLDLIP
jgi:hypothetical protein